MFDPEEIPQIKQAIRECAIVDKNLLEDLRAEANGMRSNVRVIKPRTITTFSLVATDGTNNKLIYNPFYFQIIRVVDSYGNNLCLDVITPTTDTDILSQRQFDELGNPQTLLGILMKDLGCKTLNDLSPMIPSGKKMRENPTEVSKSWVLTYRDLCEWAVLYNKICYEGFASNTVVVKDGLLRSKIFKYDAANKRPLFIEMMKKINAAIENAYKQKRIKIFFVGLAKHSQVLSRYSLAMQIENIFPTGEPRYAKVPEEMEKNSYVWKEYMKRVDGEEEEVDREVNKYSMGELYLVRFGKKSSDPVWAIDLLNSQSSADAEIFGYLYMDTLDGFPIPHYPACLQRALENAQVVDFDLDILQDEVAQAIKNILPDDKKDIIDYQALGNSSIMNRQ
ncbi:hypothetical protein U0038_08270 [Sphingobacterium spiritivorum]|uniref:NurA domain protein n=1 Tax=Sphingobacterium spiritivorum ATCC 33861 TaxID=525373 RepID=D7VGG8_SPHSI|nr:hypothetical protein [Sphingobacterium spiritivorum]EFK60143.1 hypothetical protein HMPREF0766_10087 [Sphingobacterium spiritivorum ATCC 33861]QQT34849.1 hypothetical protein I6J01_16320 [Sphingobacterium spiritivorum]WQD35739.1 hypothetical protein U0038_08270 [Sphingobacterium spiritivorum]SUJ01779.1 Uncharacterised protein [Sphingobacterium spiritivorum]